jgi:uncharacterized membrane protein
MVAAMGTYNQIAGRGLERLAALSDGLFAFAMTVIVLEIRVPSPAGIHTEAQLWQALVALGPRAITWVLSFLTLGIFWVGQQTQLNQFTHTDRDLSWLHLAFLAAVAVTPFSTEFLAEFIGFRLALVAYWLNIVALGALLYASWSYATKAGLTKDEVTPQLSAAVKRRIVLAQTLYAFGALLCVISPYWSIGFIVLVQLNYVIAPRIQGLVKLTG